ncbi:hypothetical protein Clacol_006622 [Clathrus columnatus]|uniref:Response regulatory domain-containing protein n=1 Tax=Clathrus columnatus TaxID=1419009 RepID=A0AAV5AIS6_9AGAM|nr:hypothetical protein Clacol_006622 [Clathrus columnatus]
MLQDNAFNDIVSWTTSGDSFVIKDITEFTKSILPRMFKHSNFASFVRQLNKYDFHKVKNPDVDSNHAYGDHAWTFKHPDFQANNRDALENIKRKVPSQRKAGTKSSNSNSNTNTPTTTIPTTQAPSPSPSTPPTVQPLPASTALPYSLTDSPIIQSMKSQIEHLNATVQNLTNHIRSVEQNYQSVLKEMVNFQRNMAQQDGLLQNLIQYFLQIENGKQAETAAAADNSSRNTTDASVTTTAATATTTTSSPPSALENQFVPVSEAQRIMNGAYPESDIARASFEQMNEMARIANTAGMQFAVNGVPIPGTPSLLPSPPVSKQDALQRIEELSRARPSTTTPSPLPLSLSVLMDDQPSSSNPGNYSVTLGGVIASSESGNTSSSTTLRSLPPSTSTSQRESFPGLQVFTVGHLLPRSDNAPDDGTWSFDPTSLQLNGFGLGFNGTIQPATRSGLGIDVGMNVDSYGTATDSSLVPSANSTTTAPITSRTTSSSTLSSSSSSSSTLTAKPKHTSQRLRVRRSTFVPGWAVPPRVLLVEDDAVSRKLSTKFLQVFGCTTDIAIDGVAAVNKMNLERYDLVLMDIVMPKLDGVSATSLIRQFDPMTPIISMTSNSNPSEILMYYSHGMNDILPKPFTKDGLFEMVEKHLMHLKSIQEMVRRPRSLGDPYPRRRIRATIGPAPDSTSNVKSDLDGPGSGASSTRRQSSTTRSASKATGPTGNASRRMSSSGGNDTGTSTGMRVDVDAEEGRSPSPVSEEEPDDDVEDDEEEEDPNEEVVPASRPLSDPLPSLPLQSLPLASSSSSHNIAVNSLSSSVPTQSSQSQSQSSSSSPPLQLFHPQPPMASTDSRINPLAGFRLSDEQYAVILQNIVSASDFGVSAGAVAAAAASVTVSDSLGVAVNQIPDMAPGPSATHWGGLGNMNVNGMGIVNVNVGMDMNVGVGVENIGVNLGMHSHTHSHASIEDVDEADNNSTQYTSHTRAQVLGKRREREKELKEEDDLNSNLGTNAQSKPNNSGEVLGVPTSPTVITAGTGNKSLNSGGSGIKRGRYE